MRYKWQNFNFVKAARPVFIAAIILVLAGIVSISVFGMNYGIDFKSGSSVDISVSKPVEKAKVEEFLNSEDFGKYTFTSGEERISIRFEEALTEAQQKKLDADFKSKFDESASFEINIVDVEIAKEQELNALYGILIASVGIVIYVAIRFEWRFAISAVISLLFVAFMVISIFSFFRLEVNLPFILAILTIIGYSINDTVVIFDRIRENLRFAKLKTDADLTEVVNTSISQTLTRSINTVITVAFAAICLFAFGSEALKMFSLAMILGLLIGAASSIFIASPLWHLLRRKAKPHKSAKPQNAS